MAEIIDPVAGTFCWFEVATNDLMAAKKYFGELFGWSFQDTPMPDKTPYAMAQVRGKNVGGLTLLAAEAKKMGAQPHILSYVAVEKVDEIAGKVAGFGGKLLMPVTDVGPGRVALVQDPVGGVLALWQRKEPMGPWLFGDQGALCWNELLTTDTARASTFYSKLFGWTASTMPFGELMYTVFRQGETQVGGMMQMPPEMKSAPSSWLAYVHVPDVDQAVSRATKMGGKVYVAPMHVEKVGRIATLQDPQGVVFALLQPDQTT